MLRIRLSASKNAQEQARSAKGLVLRVCLSCTQGWGMLRIRQSASKDVPATGKGWESFARITKPFTIKGEAFL